MNERSPQPDNNQGAPERGGAISPALFTYHKLIGQRIRKPTSTENLDQREYDAAALQEQFLEDRRRFFQEEAPHLQEYAQQIVRQGLPYAYAVAELLMKTGPNDLLGKSSLPLEISDFAEGLGAPLVPVLTAIALRTLPPDQIEQLIASRQREQQQGKQSVPSGEQIRSWVTRLEEDPSGHRLLTESAADFEERYRSLGDNIGAFAIAGTRATETLYQDLLALVSPE